MSPARLSDVRAGFARTDDGEQLYWRSVGQGPPVLLCNGVGVSTFFWKYLVAGLRDRYRVIEWDYRGHGRSTLPRDVATTDLSIERNARDAQTVLDALGITEPAVLFGHSMGCQVILEVHKQAPERVRALVPMFGTFARPLDTFMDSPHARRIFEQLHPLASKSGRGARRWLLPLYKSPVAFDFSRLVGLVHKEHAPQVDIDRYTDHLVRMSPDVFLGMAARMAEHDLTEHLPTIRVPVLIFGGDGDIFTPAHRAVRMSELIEGSELVLLQEASHAALVEHPALIQERVDRFLRERVEVGG